MARCKRCGRSGWFLSLTANGLCNKCETNLEDLKQLVEKIQEYVEESELPAGREKASFLAQKARDNLKSQINEYLCLDNFVGQEEIKRDLLTRIKVAREHFPRMFPSLLLCGPPEMGKATLANAIANEMGCNITPTGYMDVSDLTNLTNFNELGTLLWALESGDILLVEQLESLKESQLKLLIATMEKRAGLDITVGEGANARNGTCQ